MQIRACGTPFLSFPLEGGRDGGTATRGKAGPGASFFTAAGLLMLLSAAVPTQSHAGEAVSINGLAGNPSRGETIYHKCQGCHSIDRNRTGPMHKGLFGRQAGTVPGFDYSKAMKNAGIVWSEQTLDTFLANPRGVVPGTKMTYAGIKSAQDRADLIAYLKEATKE